MKRPMLYWAVLFVLGGISDRIMTVSMAGVTALGMAIGILFIPVDILKTNKKILLAGIVFFLMGAVSAENTEEKIRFSTMEPGKEIVFSGRVMEVEPSEKSDSYIVKSDMVDGKKIHIRIRISGGSIEKITLGSRISGQGLVKAFNRATNPGGYDEQSYQYGKGVFLSLTDIQIEERSKPVIPVREALYRLRNSLEDVYDAMLEEEDASLAAAMVLGDRTNLDADIRQLYQRNGISHLIAISGLHIAMIGGTLYHLLRKVLGSYPVSAGVGISFILLYGIMTGLSGATFRAVIMLILSIGADVFGRKYDSLTSIAAALLVMLFCNSCQITQAGFLLSFGAIMGIALVNPVWKQIFGDYPPFLDGIFVSISVQMMLIPIMLYYYYEIPVYGILLNIVVIPFMSILLAVLILCGLMGGFFPEGAVVFAKIAQGIFEIYEQLCNFSEKLPFHTVCTGRPSGLWICSYYSVLVIFLLAAYRKKERLWCAGLLYIGLFFAFLLPGSLTICMFDVGQGDGIYIRTPDNTHILIDGGSSSKQKTGNYVLKSGIKYYGGGALDYVFVTHSDMDHYSGIEELLEEEIMDIKNLVLPAISNPDEAYVRLEELAVSRGCHVYYMKQGDSLKTGDVAFLCRNPSDMEYEDKNQESIVLQMTYGNFDMFFTGDIDETVEKRILGESGSKIEVLKVSHHGSATASSESFLQKLSPDIACISVGEKNQYGHPSEEVMERLRRYCKEIYLTKDSGAITIETDGREYQIRTFLTE